MRCPALLPVRPLPLFLWLVLCAGMTAAPSAQSELVIVKEGTKMYHRPGCPVISDGKGVLAMTRAQAEGRGYKAHPDCDPSRVTAGGESKGTPGPVFVFVDAGGKLYHREKCRRLGKDAKKVALDDVWRKYWPCGVCKPPIRQRPRGRQ